MKPNLRKFIIGSAAALLALALSGQARAATLWFYNLTNNIGRIEINQRGPYKLKTDAEAAAERDHQEGLAVSPVFSIEWGLDDALKANAASAPASPPADNAPAVATNQKQPPAGSEMTAEQRLEVNTFILGIKQAMESQDLEQKKKTLQDLLGRPAPFQTLRTDQIPYWRMRAVAALELDDYGNGWAAGNNLKKLGALNSSDPELTTLMAELNLKGWLANTRDKVVAGRFSNLEGTWTVVSVDARVADDTYNYNQGVSGDLIISINDSGATAGGTLEYSKEGTRSFEGYGSNRPQKHLKLVATSIDLEGGWIGGEIHYEHIQLGDEYHTGKWRWTYKVEQNPDTTVESWTGKGAFFKLQSDGLLHIFQKSPQGAMETGFYLKKR